MIRKSLFLAMLAVSVAGCTMYTSPCYQNGQKGFLRGFNGQRNNPPCQPCSEANDADSRGVCFGITYTPSVK